MTFGLIRATVLQAPFLIFLLLVVAVMVLSNIHGYTKEIGFSEAILIWTGSVAGIAGLELGGLLLSLLLKPYFSRLFVVLPVLGAVVVTLNSYITVFHVSLYKEGLDVISSANSHLFFNIVLALVFETIFFVFVQPSLEAFAELNMNRPPQSDQRNISVSGIEIQVFDINYLHVQDHYVDVVLDSGKQMIRARMRDFVLQLNENDGVMPHRSYWVAWHKIEKVEISQNYAALTLACGQVIPIAHSRKKQMETHAKSKQLALVMS